MLDHQYDVGASNPVAATRNLVLLVRGHDDLPLQARIRVGLGVRTSLTKILVQPLNNPCAARPGPAPA